MPRPFRNRMGPVECEVDTSRLNQILEHLPGNTDQAIRAVAFAIEGKAKMKAPVDTSALRNSIYTRTDKGSFSDGKRIANLPEVPGDPVRVELPRPNDSTAHVGPSVEYAIWVEFGTDRMSAQPYLGPATNSAADELEAQMRNVVTDNG